MKPRNRWRSRLGQLAGERVVRSWLTEPGSLTARCQRGCAHFAVRVLAFGKGRPLADEAVENAGGLAWVREVALECDGVPVIFAHTTLPADSQGHLTRWMARLGNRSLGSLLFRYPGFRRGAIEFLRLDARHPLYLRAVHASGVADAATIGPTLWARRSWHQLDGQRVLVTEVFLPAIERLG